MSNREESGRVEDFYQLCERVTGYYLVERYPPFDDLGIKAADVERDLKEAKKLINTIFPRRRSMPKPNRTIRTPQSLIAYIKVKDERRLNAC